mmetsp:Transcript_125687/g.222726  ORF Transcript_125687/g.222726 Transcript_125687/m.222726 type:complete len:429 (-) Transcript_125687:71-1357(-)
MTGFGSYALASWKILRFYTHFTRRFGDIHTDLPSGKLLSFIDAKSASPGSTRISVKAGFAKEFNKAYETLQEDMRRLLSGSSQPFETTLFWSFLVRALWGCAVWVGNPARMLVFGLAQFLVAPMSFVVCIMRFGTNGLDCVLHYLLNAATVCIAHVLGSWWPGLVLVRFDGRFLLTFLAVDFALNLILYFSVNESFGSARLLKHILYGTFNTKMYFIVVIGVLNGIECDLTVIVITGLLTKWAVNSGFKTAALHALGLPCFPVLFYCEHRVGHCPFIYQQAHKMHHYLHDSTAFDAHIYGNGMNEEFFWILAETLPCLLWPGQLFPYFLNLDTLHASWGNKGGHSRTAEQEQVAVHDYLADNFHTDHHTLHRANFGSALGVFLDFYFKTQGANTKGIWGKLYTFECDPQNEENTIFCIADPSIAENGK